MSDCTPSAGGGRERWAWRNEQNGEDGLICNETPERCGRKAARGERDEHSACLHGRKEQAWRGRAVRTQRGGRAPRNVGAYFPVRC